MRQSYRRAHPDDLLITPGPGAVGIEGTEEGFTAVLRRRADQPWYPVAAAALERIGAGDMSMAAFRESRPLCYGRWDETAQAHATVGVADRQMAARNGFAANLTLDPAAVRAALAKLAAPVQLYAGDLDPLVTPAMVEAAAPLFQDATVVVQPDGGHFPWLDDATAFTTATAALLDARPIAPGDR